MKTSHSPRFKGHFFKNPFAVLPEPTALTFPKGRITPELLLHYGALAREEVALVIAGPATVVPPGSRKYSLLRVDQPKYLDGLHALSKVIRANGAIPGLQIAHPDACQADAILNGQHPFKAMPGPTNPEKVHAAYRNAVARSREVGFAYVELNGCDRLYLHRLIEEGRIDEVRALFETVIAAARDDTIMALRLPPGADAGRYGDLFLETGGDLIGFQLHGQAPGDTFSSDVLMANLLSCAPPGKIRGLLGRCRFIGLPVSFAGKQRQILEYLADVRSRKHGLLGHGGK